jgi:hypothetical protein
VQSNTDIMNFMVDMGGLMNSLRGNPKFLYQKEDIVRPHASLWGDFNFSLNGILEMEIEEQLYCMRTNNIFFLV